MRQCLASRSPSPSRVPRLAQVEVYLISLIPKPYVNVAFSTFSKSKCVSITLSKMTLSGRFWSAVTYLTSWLTISPFQDYSQRPLLAPLNGHAHHDMIGDDYVGFPPPGKGPSWAGGDFKCEYPEMEREGWIPCYEEDRQCWLRHPDGRRFDINTDYEHSAPKGVDRHYEFEITDGWWNTDGLNSTGMKLVNAQYPGPWVQACWGDRIIVNVTNKLAHNGTAIHWHGIRQNITMHMDGVPGITQCPIAPNDYFVYNFSAVQYGSSWYHSHYSV